MYWTDTTSSHGSRMYHTHSSLLTLLTLILAISAGCVQEEGTIVRPVRTKTYDNILNIRPIKQSTTIANLCGPTCAEMILRYYGKDIDQYEVGETVCQMVPEYQRKHPTHGALDCEWPDGYRETYQPILSLYFTDMGFGTETTRTFYDEETGEVNPQRFDDFMTHLRSGTPVIFHVQGHYMLAAGYNDTTSTLHYNDPADGQRKQVSYSDFRNRYVRWFRDSRESWDGRYLAVWQ